MAINKDCVQVTLTPRESKKIIALGIKKHPIIQNALKNGIILITLGTTNAYIVEELTGKKIDHKKFVAGYIDGTTAAVPKQKRLENIVLKNGKVVNNTEILTEMGAGDVVIKGANAIDRYGMAGIMMANPVGGTTGEILGPVMAQGINFIIPVGLEKTISGSISEISKKIGKTRCKKATGLAIGMMPVSGTVITEIEAFKLLGAENVFQIAAGGVNGGEGSVTLCLEGENIDELFELVEKVKKV